MTVKFNI